MIRFRHFAALGLLSAAFVTAVSAQDAKQLYDQSLVEGNSCKKMQLACQAAKIDPKKKDYSDACDRFRTSTNRSDETFRLKAIDSLSKSDYAGAARWTNSFVCNAETKQSLLSQIADAQKGSAPATPAQATPPPAVKADQSSSFLAETRTSYQEGHFDAAIASASKVTDPNLKPIADDIVSRINNYRSAVSAARQAEANKDYAGAQNSWRQAQGFDANGPDGPANNIARLEPLAHAVNTAKATPPPVTAPPPTVTKPTPNAKLPPPPPVDTGAQVAKLLDDASKAEQSNNLQSAVRDYDSVLRLQPGNSQATAAKAALLVKINSDPAEQAKSLASAIQDFYSSKYADAEDALRTYLDAPTAKSKGAAYFYMGATRLYEKVLNGAGQKPDAAIASADVQRPFKDARAAGYQPVARFVSPLVMKAWKSGQ